MSTTLTKTEVPTDRPPLEENSMRLLNAVRHLNRLLPLRKRQQSLPPPLITVHREILRSLAETGKPLTRRQIAALLGSELSAVHALAELASTDLVVLNAAVTRDVAAKKFVVQNPASLEVIGAYPMTTEGTPHQVRIGNHAVHAMCALDALAIAIMFNLETRIESRCHLSGEPIAIHQVGKEVLGVLPSAEVRLGIRWQRVEGCAAHGLCTEMVFLKDAATALAWQVTDLKSIELFTLPEALEFAEVFFVPLIQS